MATILIVDDLAANRTLLHAILERDGHTLIEAENGREALAAVRASRPALVITDVLMPVMDGYEFVRRLRHDDEISRTPVVFCTAHYSKREARALALASGVAHVMIKPIDIAEVTRVVHDVLSGEADVALPSAEKGLTASEFDRQHLRLLTDHLSATADQLRATNLRLQALINLGLELSSERDPDRLLHNLCIAARELFGASYVTLGFLDEDGRSVRQVITHGIEAAEWMAAGETPTGLLGNVIQQRRTTRGKNKAGDPAAIDLPAAHPPVRAYLAAPIASREQTFGWLCLVGNDERAFSEEDEQLLGTLAGQVGRIYENRSLSLAAQQRARVSALGADVGNALSDARALGDALKRCAEALVEHLGAAFARIWTMNDQEGVLELQASAGMYTHLNGPHGRVTVGQFKIGRIARDRKAHFTNEVVGDPEVGDQAWATREKMIAFAGHPLIVDGKVVGVMALFAQHKLSDLVSASLAAIADHVALGIERLRNADALRTAEERMRFALDAANIGIWDLNYETGVYRWSPILESHYGLAPGTFPGTLEAFLRMVHPDDREKVVDTIEASTRTGSDFTMENRAVLRNGDVRLLSGAGRVHLGPDGTPKRAVGISMDITDQRRLEEQSRQSQKMEAVGRLAGGIALDFNTLLGVILGYSQLLLSDLEPSDPHRPDIVEIEKAGARAAELTRQLLSFTGKRIIEPMRLDLNTVLGDLRQSLGRALGDKYRILMGLSPGLDPITADRRQIEETVLNLAINARDAMPNGGTLTIEAENVELDADYARLHPGVAPGAYVALTVTDNGTGVSPEVRARLFEPFFKSNEPGQGTGLELAAVHGVVTHGGGSVNVYSELGMGTSFKLYFPSAASVEVPAHTMPQVSRDEAAAHTVLVVEDSTGLRDLIAKIVGRLGYRVYAAANAEEAVRTFDAHPGINILLTDVVMPGDSGPELTKQLLARRPNLKVLYMSGFTDKAIVHHGVLQPGVAFLHKPFTADSLGRKMREVLDR